MKIYHHCKGDLTIQLFAFTPKDIDWENKRIDGGCFKNGQWVTETFRFPDVVYNRCYLKQGKTLQRLETYIGENKCFNSITYFNKWEVYKLLSGTSLKKYLPDTLLYDPQALMKQLKKNRQLILKPCYGFQGKRLYLLELTEDNQFKIYQDMLKPRYILRDEQSFLAKIAELTSGRKYLMQKKINLAKVEGKLADIRLLVQKNRHGVWSVTNGISRIAYYSFFITNCSEKIMEMDTVLSTLFCDEAGKKSATEDIHRIGVAASKALESETGLLGETAIDLAIDEDGRIWIIEINGKIQKSMYHHIEDKVSVDIDSVYKKPLEYAYYLSQQ
ncbi:YheC/D like ATP-grasp [Salipaludibacillus aurantiacus]|uniref:YheC/D like ATP-grasp n=1 Tax=Salipaludibacillus aurantiacus TaxID=1601833 RepID=A0A1H9W322_9BACI|nr:YheC/D like ATP-grasp [Salipaludibacillus aurantiacus]